MHTDLLTLQQWLSPAFPVGAFAYSHGLETAIARGWVDSAATLQDWLADLLTDGGARSDAVLLVAAYSAADDCALTRIDATARAFVASSERLLESELQGGAFTQTVNAIWHTDLPDLLLPVAIGRAARLRNLPLGATLAMSLHAFVSNLTSAATRLVPLGQTEAQATLAALTPLCHQIAKDAETQTVDDLYSNAFLSDVAAMAHETQQPRLFRS